MIILPSGRIAAITNERARYHATRRRIRVNSDSAYTKLYSLVDVIYYRQKDIEAGYKHRFTFTGFTLSDLIQSTEWDIKDKHCFMDWITQDAQINTILGAKRMLIYDNLPSKIQIHDYPRRLYSQLSSYIESINMGRAPASQWLKTLCNMGKLGIRREELRWCGLTEFLQSIAKRNNRKLSKDEILAQMDFSALRIELSNEFIPLPESDFAFDEVAEVIPAKRLAKSGIKAQISAMAVIRYVDRVLHYKVGVLKTKLPGKRLSRAPVWFALDPYGNALNLQDNGGLFDNAEQALKAASVHARQVYGYQGRLGYSNKYQYVSLCEGKDYREWLVTLPDYCQSHFSSHFTERNVLIHIRTKTRVDNSERKLLFIEEIQSDWHKTASSKINANSWDRRIPDAPFRKEWIGLAVKLMLLHAVEHGFDGIAWAHGRIQESHYHRQMPGIRRVYDKNIPQQFERLGKPWGVKIVSANIATRDPWLHAERIKDKWKVTDATGTFSTQPNLNRSEAIRCLERHSKKTHLAVPLFSIPDAMREHISLHGLPLFGCQLL
jgi:hypothetical protein